MDLRSGVFHLSIQTLAFPDIACPHLFVNSMNEGDRLMIPIYAINTDKDVWGRDALEFKCAFNQNLLLFKTNTDSLP